MRADLATFYATRDIDLQLRTGLHTGLVFLSELTTTRELMAIGDTVNTAYRLQNAAPAGNILISHDTYRHIRGVFDVQPLEPLTLRGKAEPLQAYTVLQAKPRAFRMATRGVEGIETNMVGRDADLQALQEAFQFSMDTTTTQVITVVGDAGVGKSRLLYEFDNWLELLPEYVTYFKGRAVPVMQTIPYRIIRDMFAYRYNIRETDHTADALAKFRAGVGDVLPPDQADVVGHLVGFDFATSPAVESLLGSPSFGQLAWGYLTHYIRSITKSPTVIFLEDIHWADSSSLNLVRHLHEAIPAARLLIVCLARPTLFERHPEWGQWEVRPVATPPRINLRPLTLDESKLLVHQILRKVEYTPQDLCELIVRGAEGNPYYIEELIKMMLDDGIILRHEPYWTVPTDYMLRARVPPTLTGILQARLDSLSTAEKGVLQRASVVGRRFWDDAVAHIGAATGQAATLGVRVQVQEPLQILQSKELVFQQRDSAFADAEEYMFKHALLRDVTYETVLLRLRRAYHAQAAAWLEAHAGDRLGEYLDLIAEHYVAAGEKKKAATYLQRAGEEKYKVSAFREALTAFERALELRGPDSPEYIVLLVRIGYVLYHLSEYLPAQQRLQEALDLARATGDRQTESAALGGIGWTLMGQGRYDETGPYLNPALQIAQEIGDRAGAAVILHHLGDVAYRQGDSKAAERYAGESLALYRELGSRQGMVEAHRVLGYANMAQGNYEQAAYHHGESLAIAREIGDRRGLSSALINLGETVRRQGRLREALQYYQDSLPIIHEVGNRRGEAISLLNQGHTYSALGEDDLAWDLFRQAIAVSLVIGTAAVLEEALAGIALLETRVGRHEAAAELLGFVRAHPAWNAEVEEAAQPVLDILKRELTPDQLAALLEKGRGHSQDEVVGRLGVEKEPGGRVLSTT
jgi:tetratricopeptide (TPR) repeat protein